MSPQQIERQTQKLIDKVVRDEVVAALGVVDAKILASKLRDIAFQVEVAAQELEGKTS